MNALTLPLPPPTALASPRAGKVAARLRVRGPSGHCSKVKKLQMTVLGRPGRKVLVMFGASARAEPRPLRRQWLRADGPKPRPRKAAVRCANNADVFNLNASRSSSWRVLKLNGRGEATFKLSKKETRKVCLTKKKQKRKVFVQILDLASCKASDVFKPSGKTFLTVKPGKPSTPATPEPAPEPTPEPAPAPEEPPVEAQDGGFLGCYADSADARLLAGPSYASGGMTVAGCEDFCAAAGDFGAFGVQFGKVSTCTCGRGAGRSGGLTKKKGVLLRGRAVRGGADRRRRVQHAVQGGPLGDLRRLQRDRRLRALVSAAGGRGRGWR